MSVSIITSTIPLFTNYVNTLVYNKIPVKDVNGQDTTLEIKQFIEYAQPDIFANNKAWISPIFETSGVHPISAISQPYKINNIFDNDGKITHIIYGNIFWNSETLSDKKLYISITYGTVGQTTLIISPQSNTDQYYLYIRNAQATDITDKNISILFTLYDEDEMPSDTTNIDINVNTIMTSELTEIDANYTLSVIHAADVNITYSKKRLMCFDARTMSLPSAMKQYRTVMASIFDNYSIETYAKLAGWNSWTAVENNTSYEITGWKILEKNRPDISLANMQLFKILDNEGQINCYPLYKMNWQSAGTLWIDRSAVPNTSVDNYTWTPSNNPNIQYKVTAVSPAIANLSVGVQTVGGSVSQSVIGPPSGSKHIYKYAYLTTLYNNVKYNGNEPIKITHLIKSGGPPSPYVNISPKQASVQVATNWNVLRRNNFTSILFDFPNGNVITDKNGKKISYKTGTPTVLTYKVLVEVFTR